MSKYSYYLIIPSNNNIVIWSTVKTIENVVGLAQWFLNFFSARTPWHLRKFSRTPIQYIAYTTSTVPLHWLSCLVPPGLRFRTPWGYRYPRLRTTDLHYCGLEHQHKEELHLGQNWQQTKNFRDIHMYPDVPMTLFIGS